MTILFTFVTNWEKEVVDCERGVLPAHRLFGLADLALYAVWHQREHDCIFAVNEGSAFARS